MPKVLRVKTAILLDLDRSTQGIDSISFFISLIKLFNTHPPDQNPINNTHERLTARTTKPVSEEDRRKKQLLVF